MHWRGAYATTTGVVARGGAAPGTSRSCEPLTGDAPPRTASAAAVPVPPHVAAPGRSRPTRDLRGQDSGDDGEPVVRQLRYPPGDVVVVSGLPGSGKTTLVKRTVATRDARGAAVHRIDSQDARDRWERRLPAALPYVLYRPLVRIAHYAGLRRALRSGGSVVVHDCGSQPWVRRWLARDARRRGRAMHLVLLDVPPQAALAGQAARGRGVSQYAFGRHRGAVRRLVADVEGGRLPDGCASAVLLDRPAADALQGIEFR